MIGWLVLGAIFGFLIGRYYAYMKYHYPENQEKIRVMIARHRLQRIQIEEKEEEIKARIDESLDKRMRA